MLTLGVDPSSKIFAGVLIGDDGQWNTYRFEVPKGKYGPQAAARFYDFVTETFEWLPPTSTVWIEEPVVGRGVRPTIVQAMASGAMQAGFKGFDTYLVNVSTWKKEVVGKGNASKDEVAKAVMLNVGPRFAGMWDSIKDSQDLIDAAALAIYGRRMVDIANG